MLTSSIMAWVALWILWGNTALVALAALRRAAGLLRRARTLSPRASSVGAASIEAKVVAADDPSGKLAELEVEQVGRLGAGTEASIVFHDRAHRSRAFGGEVETSSGERIRIEPTDEAEVWLDEEEVRAAAAAPAAARFDEAAAQAKKARGYTNLVRVPVNVGDRVFVAGRATGGATKTIGPSGGGALVISKIDPSAWARRRALAVMLGFVPAIFAAAGVATALALVPPVFDSLWSKLGGALGLAHFLLVLPAGTAARDWMRMPFERFVRGSWTPPRAGAAERAVSN